MGYVRDVMDPTMEEAARYCQIFIIQMEQY